MSPPEQAGTKSTPAFDSAFNIMSTARSAGHIVKVGAGSIACITHPGGAITFKGLKLPSFAAVSGVVTALNTNAAVPIVMPIGTFIGPLVCGSEPVKSTIISVSDIVTVTLIFTNVSLSIPSSSTQSSADQVPLGRSASCTLAIRSP